MNITIDTDKSTKVQIGTGKQDRFYLKVEWNGFGTLAILNPETVQEIITGLQSLLKQG
jgi:hypothetical protein